MRHRTNCGDSREKNVERIFLNIQRDTLRGVLCQARPLARLLIRETALEPTDIVLLIGKIYALWGEVADDLLATPQVLSGLPLEFFNDASTQDLITHLQQERSLHTMERGATFN